jgi:hypothetical protein
MEFTNFFFVMNYIMLASLLWSDWYDDTKPNFILAIFMFIVYIIFTCFFVI